MYITITKQSLAATYNQSATDYVAYLEKENEGRSPDLKDYFFDQDNDRVEPDQVIKEIDSNTDRLKKHEPKFYSLTINPSQRELKAINNDPVLLRKYVRETMKDYAAAFYRETPVSVDQIKYYAKIEHQRLYKGYDKEIKENQVYKAKIAQLENDIRKVERGELKGNPQRMRRQIEKLYADIPHRIDGQIVKQGMKKPGHQMHVHIIMSRKDTTNRYSLSPGSSYKESEAPLNGQVVKRGFKRDQFFEAAEKTFDRLFAYQRNYVERYAARKTLATDTVLFFATLAKLPTSEHSAAFKLLAKAGINLPIPSIPTSKMDLLLSSIKHLKKAMDTARGAGGIEI